MFEVLAEKEKEGWSNTHLCSLENKVYLSSLCLLGLFNRLEEPLQVLRLLLQEFDFLLTRFGIILAFLVNDGLNSFNLGLLLKNALLLPFLALFKLAFFRGQLCPSVLSLQLLAHGKRHRAVIESLIGLDVRVNIPLDA